MNEEAPGIGREAPGIVRRESFDPEWPKSIWIKPRNASFGIKNGSFEVNKPLVNYFAIFNGSFGATKPSHRRTKAARMTQEVIRIQASTSWLTTNTPFGCFPPHKTCSSTRISSQRSTYSILESLAEHAFEQP